MQLGESVVPVIPPQEEGEDSPPTTFRLEMSLVDTLDFCGEIDRMSRNKVAAHCLKYALKVHISELQAEMKGRNLERELAEFLEKRARSRAAKKKK